MRNHSYAPFAYISDRQVSIFCHFFHGESLKTQGTCIVTSNITNLFMIFWNDKNNLLSHWILHIRFCDMLQKAVHIDIIIKNNFMKKMH